MKLISIKLSKWPDLKYILLCSIKFVVDNTKTNQDIPSILKIISHFTISVENEANDYRVIHCHFTSTQWQFDTSLLHCMSLTRIQHHNVERFKNVLKVDIFLLKTHIGFRKVCLMRKKIPDITFIFENYEQHITRFIWISCNV